MDAERFGIGVVKTCIIQVQAAEVVSVMGNVIAAFVLSSSGGESQTSVLYTL